MEREEQVMGAVAIAETKALLQHYGFDLWGREITAILEHWQQLYPVKWLRLATLEALYRGRYKTVSVEKILRQWRKKDEVQTNFDPDFEILICSKLEQLQTLPEAIPSMTTPSPIQPLEIQSFQPDCPNLEIYTKLKAIATHPPESSTPDKQQPQSETRA